jgi:hypothetical protein|tara:strand:- start:63 stop:755 length:693 start_codon:yes stop_codon:yes gene_type:complete
MELEKNNVTTFEQEKSLTTQEQYEIDKKKKWEENKRYVANEILSAAAKDLAAIEELADGAISNGQWVSRLYAKLIERKMEIIIHPEFKTRTIRDAETGVYMYKTGRYMSEFNIGTACDGLHLFGEARFDHHNDRAVDFILINKKGSFVKKYAIECQTNKGHLAPMDKHRDCILGRYIAFRTDYHFLEYSSYEIFGDSNISSIDELIDDLEFGNRNLVYNSNKNNIDDLDF